MTELMSDAVRRIMVDCLYLDDEVVVPGEAPEGAIQVEGVIAKFALHPDRVAAARVSVDELLMRLPPAFMDSIGGGMSFLNACMNAEGEHWAEHQAVDSLMVLGVATGLVTLPIPMGMWQILPGGMPYFTVNDAACAAAIAGQKANAE